MKTSELIEKFKPTLSNTSLIHDNIFDDTFFGEQLKIIKDELLQCEEFSEVKELIIIDASTLENINGKIFKSQSYRLTDKIKFSGKAYIYSLSLAPEQWKIDDLNKSVKDGISISPIIYDQETLEPKAKIIVEYSPINGDETEILNRLKLALDNPDEYKIKGKREVIVRGIFEEIVHTDNIAEYMIKNDVGNLKLDVNNQSFFTVFSLRDVVDNGNMTIKLIDHIIDNKFKNLFFEKFNIGQIIKYDDIKIFCDENNINIE
jgi:hypothetical protein